MAAANSTARGCDEIRKEEHVWGDIYSGTSEALVKAGIVELHELPGQPGQNKTMVTFRGEGADYKRITRSGKKFRVWKGVPHEEQNKRRGQAQAEREKQEQERLLEIVDHLALKIRREAEIRGGAQFEVGDACIYHAPSGAHTEQVEIVGEYQIRRVKHAEGAYTDANGTRFNYQWGYNIRAHLGVFFCPAGHLRDLNEKVRHVRLVSSQAIAPPSNTLLAPITG